jgi:maltose O-acetyltransferase
LSKTEKQKMLAGELYRPGDAELQADAVANTAWLVRYNAALAAPVSERHALLSEHLGDVGEGVVIRPPFFCDYGYNIRLGDEVFLNFNCVILDIVDVAIGDRTQIGPAVQIYAADHPRDVETRRAGFEFGRPVHRQRRLDRRRCHHPARRYDRRWRGDRSRQRGHAGCRCQPDRRRKSGTSAPSETVTSRGGRKTGRALRFPLPAAMEWPHVRAAHHTH